MKILPARAFVVLSLFALVHLSGVAQGERPSDSVEKAFAKGGRIRFDLSAGDYTIRGGAIDAIKVRWQTEARFMSSVRTDVIISGAVATVRTDGPRQKFRVEIDVPQRADLDVELTAGDLKVRGVEGNKTLSMWAGDVTIDVGDPGQYQRVDATVKAGEITANPFGRSTGGLFRSLHWKGPGRYILDARLTAGDLKLVK